jgi:hypothetical protein
MTLELKEFKEPSYFEDPIFKAWNEGFDFVFKIVKNKLGENDGEMFDMAYDSCMGYMSNNSTRIYQLKDYENREVGLIESSIIKEELEKFLIDLYASCEFSDYHFWDQMEEKCKELYPNKILKRYFTELINIEP